VFFDKAGVRWEYEAEGYETPTGRYLPDFVLHLPCGPTLFEVKPESQIGIEDSRWWGASRAAGMRLFAAYGMPRITELQPCTQPGNGLLNLFTAHKEWESWDNFYGFCTCPWCGAVGVEFDGRGARVCGHARHEQPYEDKAYSYDDPKLVRAYIAAHSARFEFDQRSA
jgi:hypothetical protein